MVLENLTQTEVVGRYGKKVEFIARRIANKLPKGSQVGFEDLSQAGMLGLFDAVGKFDYDNGASFGTYVEFRIRGAIIDLLRSIDPLSRTERDKIKSHNQVIDDFRAEGGVGKISVEDYARLADVDIEVAAANILEYGTGMYNQRIVSLDKPIDDKSEDSKFVKDMIEGSDDTRPDVINEKANVLMHLGSLIERLPERLQYVVFSYYYNDMNLKSIGDVLGVTESRVSQLLTEAKDKLRVYLFKDLDIPLSTKYRKKRRSKLRNGKMPPHVAASPILQVLAPQDDGSLKPRTIQEYARYMKELLKLHGGEVEINRLYELLIADGFVNQWEVAPEVLIYNCMGHLFADGINVFIRRVPGKIPYVVDTEYIKKTLNGSDLQGRLKALLDQNDDEIDVYAFVDGLMGCKITGIEDQKKFFMDLIIKLASEGVMVPFVEREEEQVIVCLEE